ncbi:MAG: tail protein X [Pirellulaceae bacterium]
MSLFDIAARVYGQAGRYVELIELNPQSDLARRDPLEPLPKGTRLHLPVVR